MNEVNRILDDIGLRPAPAQPVRDLEVNKRLKRATLRTTKPPGESKAARRMRRRALVG